MEVVADGVRDLASVIRAPLPGKPARARAAPAPQKQLGRSLVSAGPPVGRIWRK